MSDYRIPIKFSFEGPVGVLVKMLTGLQDSPPEEDPAPAILPRSVTQQIPPRPPSIYPVESTIPTQKPRIVPIQPDPVYGDHGAYGPPSMLVESAPVPSEYPPLQPVVRPDFDFGALPLKEEAWAEFQTFVENWVVGFDCPLDDSEVPEIKQPDRLQLLKGLGSGRWAIHILRWCAHYKSLQGAVHAAIQAIPATRSMSSLDTFDELLDFVDRISANISQVAHAAFPDIADFHDYSTKWKRNIAS